MGKLIIAAALTGNITLPILLLASVFGLGDMRTEAFIK